ncbi:hypothetical protein [Bacillus changyiensis]|uniref:hypothetical protein n=1 Tax=Bacillus changyiensis TaxID=3004103 RepID=UPI0022E1D890|nr:hypothetical protein [Bacillus changyiensis]MDA1476937.1 hypothetical protein [Bacillus changyiensis]
MNITNKLNADELMDVIIFTNSAPHHTVTPIARNRNDIFEIDLVLRNEYPLVLFPLHADVHYIKA